MIKSTGQRQAVEKDGHSSGFVTSVENSRNDAEKRRHVEFAGDANRESALYLPLAQAKKQKRQNAYQQITRLWVKLSQANQYDQLLHSLSNFDFNTQKMNDYFDQEGSFLLRCAVSHWREAHGLQFMIDHLPEDLLQKTLSRNNYAILDGFLLGLSGLEKEGLIDGKRILELHEKFKLLLTIDFAGLEGFSKSEYFKERYESGVKTSFQQAIEAYKVVCLPKAKF